MHLSWLLMMMMICWCCVGLVLPNISLQCRQTFHGVQTFGTDLQQPNVTGHNKRYLIYFWKYEISALSKRQLNKLSNDTKLLRIEVPLLKIWEKDWLYFLLFSLFFYNLFCSISKNKPGRHKVHFVVMCHKCVMPKYLFTNIAKASNHLPIFKKFHTLSRIDCWYIQNRLLIKKPQCRCEIYFQHLG